MQPAGISKIGFGVQGKETKKPNVARSNLRNAQVQRSPQQHRRYSVQSCQLIHFIRCFYFFLSENLIIWLDPVTSAVEAAPARILTYRRRAGGRPVLALRPAFPPGYTIAIRWRSNLLSRCAHNQILCVFGVQMSPARGCFAHIECCQSNFALFCNVLIACWRYVQ